ncbi:MAG: UvrD-helicase domain-containing protein [Chloroflexota bacterium]
MSDFLDLRRFYEVAAAVARVPNDEQAVAVNAPAGAGVFIVAGPGSGKTAAVALRMLKLIFVDGIAPDRILATTFTNKAAEELRSRLLQWGFGFIDHLTIGPLRDPRIGDWLRQIDVNQVVTGTIDSICERALRDFRQPNYRPPALADDFITATLMVRDGLLETNLWDNEALHDLLLDFNAGQTFGFDLLLANLWSYPHDAFEVILDTKACAGRLVPLGWRSSTAGTTSSGR